MAKKKIKNNVVLTSRDLLNGYVANNYDYNIYNMTPLQMIPIEEKDEDWKKWNLDWLERAGLRQLSHTQAGIVQNYYLANGILNKNDYTIGGENELSSSIQQIAMDNISNIPLKFYPIIPNVVNVLCGEFSKRDNRIIAIAVDDNSLDEKLEYKKQLLEQALLEMYTSNSLQDPDTQSDPQAKQKAQQKAQESLTKTEVAFKTYRGIPEQWANHRMLEDNERFDMYQKEYDGFRDSLVADREFWEIRLLENDYQVNLWETWLTFYHKSETRQYISEANYVGRIRTLSIPDVIDMYGEKMTEDQLLQLKNHYRTLNSFPIVTDGISDQENWYTNTSQPFPKSRTNVTWQKWLDGQVGQMLDGKAPRQGDMNELTWFDLNNRSTSYIEMDVNGPGMVRVTEAYWKSQRRVGHLTRIDKTGVLIQSIVDEGYIVTEKPIYDTSLNKAKTKTTLVEGEHIDWIWINEVRYGVKLNSSLSTYYSRNYSDFEPIYIGGDPIPFQFKGTDNLYGCKLPVEGKIFSERGSRSSSLVEKLKPNQINFNIVNNQIVEMLADEVGNVLVMDQNMIPRNSLNGEWGKYNYPMFHQVMKDYQLAAIDPSIRNTEAATNFAHFQTVDLTKTQQILSRMKLAEYFKNEAFAVVGITPQRLGEVSPSETATGTQQAVNNSYTQTEIYFDQHMNHLMPRVRQMMLDAAQYYAVNKPQARVNYLNRDEENTFFQIEGDKLLLRDFRVYAKSTANVKATLEQLRQLAIQNNTAGGSMYEIAQMLTLQSPSEIIAKLKKIDEDRQQQMQAQQEHEQQLQAQAEQHEKEMEQQIEQHDDYWKEREIQKEIYIHEIDALGRAKNNDLNADSIPDPLEVRKFLHDQGIDETAQFAKQQDIDLKRQKMMSDIAERSKDRQLEREKIKVEREKIQASKQRPKSK